MRALGEVLEGGLGGGLGHRVSQVAIILDTIHFPHSFAIFPVVGPTSLIKVVIARM